MAARTRADWLRLLSIPSYCLHLPWLTGQLGDSLQRLAAQRTASLKPAHQWVPWVVVNGIPLLDDDENVSDVPCRAIQSGRTIAGLCGRLHCGTTFCWKDVEQL